MVEWISNWAQGIIIAVIVATIIEMILPEGNCKKYIKVVIGVYILFTIISPVISKITGNSLSLTDIIDIDKYIEEASTGSSTYKDLNNKNERNIKEIYISSLKSDIKQKVENKEYIVKNLEIEVENTEEYALKNISLTVRKEQKTKENKKQENEIKAVNEISVNISEDKNNSEEKGKEESQKELSSSEKSNLKDYLSSVYEINKKDINIY